VDFEKEKEGEKAKNRIKCDARHVNKKQWYGDTVTAIGHVTYSKTVQGGSSKTLGSETALAGGTKGRAALGQNEQGERSVTFSKDGHKEGIIKNAGKK